MDRKSDGVVDFTLAPAGLRFPVDVRLSRARGRWVAVAAWEGRAQTGIGSSPRTALAAAFDPLGRTAASVLLADTALLEPSLRLAGSGVGSA